MNVRTLPQVGGEAVSDRFVTNDSASRPTVTPGMKTLAARLGIGALIVALVVAGTLGTRHYWVIGRYMESTDDAYVKADSSTIAPKVSGYIQSVLVDDNQQVVAGQILARIDDGDLQTALDEATANVTAAAASIANLTAQLIAQDSVIKQAEANVAVAKTSLALSQRNEQRRREMAKIGYGSNEQSDDAAAASLEKTSLLAREQAAAATAHQQIAVLQAQQSLARAQLDRAQALRHQAELNVSYAAIRAPIDGTVGARSIRVGQYVQAGTQLMELVPLAKTYVVANFKETQLARMHDGQAARIAIDAYPENDLRARVVSVAPASGMEFSLLPPDNATGNFTKIVQRIPVKLVLDNDGSLAGRLRPGMSVQVTVDTKPAPATPLNSTNTLDARRRETAG